MWLPRSSLSLSIGPSVISDVIVIPTYKSRAESAELNEMLVKWERVVRICIRTYVHTYTYVYYGR